MSNDVNEYVILGVQLMVVSVILGALMVVLGLGMHIKREGLETVATIESAMNEGELAAIEEYTKNSSVPVASVYMSLIKNEKLVRNITINGTKYIRDYTSYNYDDMVDSLRPMLSKTCVVTCKEYNHSGIYDIEVVVNP